MSRREEEAAAWFARMRAPDAADHRAAFGRWRNDPENAAAYAQAEEDWLFAGGIARDHVRAHGAERTIARSAPMRWAMAATILLGLGLGAAWYIRPDPQATSLAQGAAAKPGGVRLADDSSVELMDGARIETRFDKTARRVILTGGRARFTVAHDAQRPFIVIGGGSETTALGTIFEVDLRAGRPRIHLVRGAVEVRAAGGTATVRLAPGESAEVDGRDARRVASRSAVPGSATMLDADNLPLGAIIERANRTNAVPIRLADPALAMRRVTGRFDVADSRALARKLATALGLDLASGPDGHMLGAEAKKAGG